MSWSEVKKINGNLAKPLDVLIAEQIASQSQTLQANITNAQNSTVSSVTNNVNASINNLSNVTQNGGVKVVKSTQHGVLAAGSYSQATGMVDNFLISPGTSGYGRYSYYVDIPISPVNTSKSILLTDPLIKPISVSYALTYKGYFVSGSVFRLFVGFSNQTNVLTFAKQDYAMTWTVVEFY